MIRPYHLHVHNARCIICKLYIRIYDININMIIINIHDGVDRVEIQIERNIFGIEIMLNDKRFVIKF